MRWPDLLARARSRSRFVVSSIALLVLVARVDDRVELLEHPRLSSARRRRRRCAAGRPRQAVDQLVERALRRRRRRCSRSSREQPRQRVDGDRAVRPPSRPWRSASRASSCRCRRRRRTRARGPRRAARSMLPHVAAGPRATSAGVHRRHRLAVERHAAEALRDPPADSRARACARSAAGRHGRARRPLVASSYEEARAVAARRRAGAQLSGPSPA